MCRLRTRTPMTKFAPFSSSALAAALVGCQSRLGHREQLGRRPTGGGDRIGHRRVVGIQQQRPDPEPGEGRQVVAGAGGPVGAPAAEGAVPARPVRESLQRRSTAVHTPGRGRFQLGLFENPYSDSAVAVATVGKPEFKARADAAQESPRSTLGRRPTRGPVSPHRRTRCRPEPYILRGPTRRR